MKEVKIKFIDAGINDKFQYYVTVYDNNGNIYFDDYTFNGLICFNVKVNTYLNVLVSSFRGMMKKGIVICNNDTYILFYDSSIIKNKKLITFILTDANYFDLPIEEGELYL